MHSSFGMTHCTYDLLHPWNSQSFICLCGCEIFITFFRNESNYFVNFPMSSTFCHLYNCSQYSPILPPSEPRELLKNDNCYFHDKSPELHHPQQGIFCQHLCQFDEMDFIFWLLIRLLCDILILCWNITGIILDHIMLEIFYGRAMQSLSSKNKPWRFYTYL